MKYVIRVLLAWLVVFVIGFIVAAVCNAAGRSGHSCGSCYTPTYYPQTYYQPEYYYPPERELVYVNSVQLWQPFEFRFVPPTAVLQLYGVPQITSTTVTTTTTSAVSNGATQQIAVGGGAPTITTGGVTTVAPGQPQPIGDDLPVASPGQPQARMGSGVAGVLKTHCSSCHSGSNGSGGVTLLDSGGRVDLRRQGGALTLYDILMAIDGIPMPMPPASAKDPSKKVPAAQRRILWDELRKGGK